MQTPQYTPSAFALKVQRRIISALLVALLAGVTAYLSWPVVQRAMLLRGLDAADPTTRLRAANRLLLAARDEPALYDRVLPAVIGLAEDGRLRPPAVQMLTWAAGDDAARDRLAVAARTSDGARLAILAEVLAAVGAWSAQAVSADAVCRLAVNGVGASSPDSRAAAVAHLAELGPTVATCARDTLVAALDAADPAVRRAAVQSAAVCLRDPQLITPALQDPQETVRDEAGRCLAALVPDTRPPDPTAADVQADLDAPDRWTRLAAVVAAGTVVGEDGAALIPALRARVAQALASGDGLTAGAALESLARLGDRAYLQVMLDTAGRFVDQPRLRLMGARAAARLDAGAGGAALVQLLTLVDDGARDGAILALSALPLDAIRQPLELELFGIDGLARGAAALTLALVDADVTVRGTRLTHLLERRLDLERDNLLAETDWLPRGYYLCALTAAGVQRPDIAVFELNDNFPRSALFMARLHTGDPWPLETLFSVACDPVCRVRLLRNQRCGEIVARYLPTAPGVSWWRSPEACLGQVEALRVWWSIHRWDEDLLTR